MFGKGWSEADTLEQMELNSKALFKSMQQLGESGFSGVISDG